MFNQITCSGPKDLRFNEQLLLAALKMFVREKETHTQKESRDPKIQTQTMFIFHRIYSLNTYNVINKAQTACSLIQCKERVYNLSDAKSARRLLVLKYTSGGSHKGPVLKILNQMVRGYES